MEPVQPPIGEPGASHRSGEKAISPHFQTSSEKPRPQRSSGWKGSLTSSLVPSLGGPGSSPQLVPRSRRG